MGSLNHQLFDNHRQEVARYETFLSYVHLTFNDRQYLKRCIKLWHRNCLLYAFSYFLSASLRGRGHCVFVGLPDVQFDHVVSVDCLRILFSYIGFKFFTVTLVRCSFVQCHVSAL